MQKGMLSVPGLRPADRHRRLPALLAVAAAAVVSVALPAAPAHAGSGHTVVGTLVQAWPESAQESPSTLAAQPLSWVEGADGATVRVPTADVADVPAGATVSVTVGGKVSDAASTDGGYGPAHEVLAASVVGEPAEDPAAPAGSRLTNQVTVAMVVPHGGTRDGATLDQMVTAVNGPVARFWSDQSGGAIRIGVTATHDWITTAAGCADPTALWNETAAAVGFVPGPGKHLVVYVSSEPGDLAGCSFALGEIGSSPATGGRLYVREVLPSVIAHELGHNFGLGHSSAQQCDDAVETGTCRTEAYRDYYDVMGASWEQLGSLNAAQAARLGLLPASAQRSFDASTATGAVTLAPLSGRSGTRAVRLTAAGVSYWLEYRAAVGQDAWLGTSADRFDLQAGVLLHRAGALPDTSLLLDGSPAGVRGWDDDLQVALPVGVAVPVAGGRFTVTVASLTANAATLQLAATPAAAAPAPVPAPSGAVGGVMTGQRCTATTATCAGSRSTGGSGATAQAAVGAGATGNAAAPPEAAAPGDDAAPHPAAPARVRTAEAASVHSTSDPSLVWALGALAACVLLLGSTPIVRGRLGRGTPPRGIRR